MIFKGGLKVGVVVVGLLYFLIILFILQSVNGFIPVEKDLWISQTERWSLNQFRNRVLPKIVEEYSYMKSDLYMIRWLRAKDNDVDGAENAFLEMLKWRRENRIDDLDKEDWSYFKRDFGFTVDTVNKRGQPILTVDQDQWNVRHAILMGKTDKLKRWMIKMLEDASKKVLEVQAEGKAVTRWNFLNSLENYSLMESGCIPCIGVYVAFVQNYEKYYPQMLDEIIFVDSPRMFDVVLRMVRPIMSERTRDSIRLLGTNKKQWRSQLLREINPDQLPSSFGGTRQQD